MSVSAASLSLAMGDTELLSAAQATMECAFGVPMEIVPAETVDGAPPARNKPHRPCIEPVCHNRYRVELPFVDRSGALWRAEGEVTTSDAVLLNSLATTVLAAIDGLRQHHEHTDELDEFVQQLGDSMEEVTWLRRLATRLPTCDASQSLSDVCQTVLPPLRALIHAESIALLTAPSSATDAEAASSIWIGPPICDLQVCRRIAERLATRTSEHAFVFNSANASRDGNLRSGIIARLATSHSHYGWLVAVNRIPSAGIAAWEGQYGGCTETEFGTVEAGLLDATAVMLATHHRNAELYREQERLTIGVIRTLINAIDAKDRYTCGHSDRVARMARRLAEELGLNRNECDRLYVTGLLHDVGKIGVPDHVLQKPGKLTPEEFDLIKQHPRIGYDIIRPLRQLSYALPGVLHHHESMDGRGYPDGLRGAAIPLAARILAVADAYDAMTSCRPYRNALSFERAEAVLQENAGTQWDAAVVTAFQASRDDLLDICRHETAAAEPDGESSGRPSANNLWAEFPWRSDSLAAALVGSES